MLIPESLLGQNVCLSGGAEGADTAWGEAAQAAGHHVIHWSFDRHRTKVPADQVVRLTPEHLAEADHALALANKSLKRRWPVRDPYTANLLRRNFFQVRWSEAVYGVAGFEDRQVTGGTAWAIQMYLDRWIHRRADLDLCRAFVFDQKAGRWYRWYTGWEEIDAPPRPSGIYGAVGSSDLLPLGSETIVKLYSEA